MHKQFDLLVIGGGSGGIATAIKAAQLGARCAIIEEKEWGGTCVNLGCVPKKLMWLASDMANHMHNAKGYGFEAPQVLLNWAQLVGHRQAYIENLHRFYINKMESLQISMLKGRAHFIATDTVKVDHQILSARHIVIATGSKATHPKIQGTHLGIDSDGFFQLTQVPKRAAVVGAGYIAIELAGILHHLGCETMLLFRYDKVLRSFDSLLSDRLMSLYQQQGIALLAHHRPTAIESSLGKLSLLCKDQQTIPGLDTVIWAIGRTPNTQGLQLEHTAVQLNTKGAIAVDLYQNTHQPGVYAIGDITAQKALTPVAIAQGRCLATRLFGQDPKRHLPMDNIPSVIFSHPPIASVGLTEEEARAKFAADIQIYQTQFTPMSQALNIHPLRSAMKLICVKSTDKVVGCHLIGDHVDEVLQGFALAINMGATKKDFDNIVAIHPTSAEELVTIPSTP